MTKGYTIEEWKELTDTREGLAKLAEEVLAYADKKNVRAIFIDTRWVRGRSQYYVSRARMRNEKMNND